MSSRLVTEIVVAVSALGWAVYTSIMAANGQPGDTISEVIARAGREHPMIPFAVGVLIGHWFWSIK